LIGCVAVKARVGPAAIVEVKIPPIANLIRVDVELLGKLRQCPIALDGGTPAFKSKVALDGKSYSLAYAAGTRSRDHSKGQQDGNDASDGP
jgi:hypothetical protein